jgi:eukaryotic-like serine/threonine-protein kinase
MAPSDCNGVVGVTEDRWRKVADVYGAAQDKTPSGRLPFVREASAGDSDLRRQVESLLAQDDQPHVLDIPLPETAAEILDNPHVQSGTLVGPYRIESLLGVGGMGEVYRARDTKLNRNVAIKILPPAFASDPDRLARFKREAQVLASLNHPNVGGIYGFEDEGGIHALVLELVEGPTLADLLASGSRLQASGRGGLPIDDALAIARQIADALEAAHEQGIIHRDLKPANIKVREDGTVKVLDFGLAKLADPVGAGLQDGPSITQSPTITTPAMTAAGMILGTAAYMSPEQARGKSADKRSDIWAFGCVLYEMLAGRRAFEDDEVADTLAAVLRATPDWSALPDNLPASCRDLLVGCLEKDRQKRIGDIAVARFAFAGGSAARREEPALAAPRRKSTKIIPALVAAVSSVLAGVGVWTLTRKPESPAHGLVRLSLPLPDGQTFWNMGVHYEAISRDGKQIVYLANQQLFVRALSDLQPKPIPGTQTTTGLIGEPVFSPDGTSVAYWTGVTMSNGTIKIAPVSGGTSTTIASVGYPLGMRWEADYLLLGQVGKGIIRVPARGGDIEVLASIQAGEVAQGPQLLAGGSLLLFALATGAPDPINMQLDRWDNARIVVQSLTSSERKTVIEGGSDARYVSSGHIVYARGTTLMAVPFDANAQTATAKPVPVIEGVTRAGNVVAARSGAAHYDISDNGTLIYVPGSAASENDLALIDQTGRIEPFGLPRDVYEYPRVSPDGKRLAFFTSSDDGKSSSIWVYELSRVKAPRKLTLDARSRYPVWSPDSTRIVFSSDRDGAFGLYVQRFDGTGQIQRLTSPPEGVSHVPESWSRKTDVLLYSEFNSSGHSLFALSMNDRRVRPLNIRSSQPINAMFSPDGRWIAYTSDEGPGQGPAAQTASGAASGVLYLEPYPPTGAKYPVTRRQGLQALWSPDGHELFFNSAPGQIAKVTVDTSGIPSFGIQQPVPKSFVQGGPTRVRNFDMTPDGKFAAVVLANPTNSSAPQIQVMLNWFEDLERKAPIHR